MNKFIAAAGAALLLTLSGVSTASAQATRTWISGVGDDANPCSRTAPCKTFAGAISKTAVGGEIDVLDPGGFGAVTITKSITLDGSGGSIAGMLASGTNGVIINGAGVVVVLRNLSISGAPGTGINGIRFLQGASLTVEKSVISGFQAAGASDVGFGIQFAPSAAAELSITDTTFSGNGNTAGATGGGIQIRPTGSGSARVTLENVVSTNNVIGIRADGSASTGGGIVVSVSNGVFSNNDHSGVVAIAPGGGQSVNMMLADSTSANNGVVTGASGVRADGALSTVRMSGTAITGNGLGVSTANGAQLLSYGDNLIDGNTSNGANPAVIVKH